MLSSDSHQTQQRIDAYYRSAKTCNYVGWHDFFINALLRYSIGEKSIIRNQVKYTQISFRTFMGYLLQLTQIVEEKVTAPKQFAILFDGQKSGSTHYLAVFASFCSRHEGGVRNLPGMLQYDDGRDAPVGWQAHRFHDIRLAVVQEILGELSLYNCRKLQVQQKYQREERYTSSRLCESQV